MATSASLVQSNAPQEGQQQPDRFEWRLLRRRKQMMPPREGDTPSNGKRREDPFKRLASFTIAKQKVAADQKRKDRYHDA